MKLARVYKRKRKNKPFEVKYYDKDGKRSSLSFQNKLEADSFASECNNECKLPAQLQFSTEERIEFAKFREIATAKGIPLVDAIKKCLDMLKGINPAQKISVSDLRKEYLRDCAKRKMRQSTIDYYDQHIRRFEAFAGGQSMIHNINIGIVQSYLLSCGSREHAKRVLSALFKYSKDHEYVSENFIRDIKLPKALKDRKNAEILTVAQAEENLMSLNNEYRPAFALLAFIGARPDEVCNYTGKPVIEWKDIDFKNRKITVRAEVAKTRRARIITDAPPNIWDWLKIGKKSSGNVFPHSYALFRRARRSMPVKLSSDVFRHSFASYGYHYLGIEKSVEIMGQEGGYSVYKKHYKGIATPKDAEAYFNIKPQI